MIFAPIELKFVPGADSRARTYQVKVGDREAAASYRFSVSLDFSYVEFKAVWCESAETVGWWTAGRIKRAIRRRLTEKSREEAERKETLDNLKLVGEVCGDREEKDASRT